MEPLIDTQKRAPMRRFAPRALLLLGLGPACNQRFDEYYTGAGPSVSELSSTVETGNVGGHEVVLRGSDFGDDVNAISVVFGSQNAEVISISDGELVVRSPRGPVEGGPVDVVVATPAGQERLSDAYVYDVTPDQDDIFAQEMAYVGVTNDWFSCFGGLGLADAALPPGFGRGIEFGLCGQRFFAPTTGRVGIGGRAEVLEFAYPRVHNVFTAERNGFGGSWDLSFNEWSVQVPPQEVIGVDVEGSFEDLRVDVGDFQLVNEDVRAALSSEEREFCLEEAALGTFEVDAGPEVGVVGFTGSIDAPVECGNDTLRYDVSEMPFCQEDEYETTRSFRWLADWPIARNFFQGQGEEGLADDAPVRVSLAVPGAGIDRVSLTLPEPARFLGTSGWANQGDPQSAQSGQPVFMLYGPESSCQDTNGDGEVTGDETVAVIEWLPSAFDPSDGSGIVGSRTFVRFSMSLLTSGWFGGEGTAMKATITVPDAHNVDPETGRSRLEIPASVMYRFPSVGGAPYYEDETLAPVVWGAPETAQYGFTVFNIDRITEYVVEAPALDGGHLAFAYATGDFAYPVFAEWQNPLTGTSCGDCADSDGDGWSDKDDPDCLDGAANENNSRFGEFTCNDGIDNDADGLIDAEDDNCAEGFRSEANCGDGVDNDGDGWVDDREDPDCRDLGYEAGFGDSSCNDGVDNDGDGDIDAEDRDCGSWRDAETNCGDGVDNDGDGLVDEDDPECGDEADLVEDTLDTVTSTCTDLADNDGDGWIDAEDPDCERVTGDELGYGDAPCNNGLDDDGQGDVDRDDPSCARGGAEADETPTFAASCADGADNDGDGYTDGNDPDCEQPPFSTERFLFVDPARVPATPACYNGVDDDGDGFTDAQDPGCVNGAGEPSGFAGAEDPARPGCSNGQDDDADGYLDVADPDCALGDLEIGLGLTACNDGVDNDGDTAVDAEDVDCVDALDDDEAP
jgi:hypothetical protein